MLIIWFILLLGLLTALISEYSEVFLIIHEGLRVKICFALFSVELSNFKDGRKRRKDQGGFNPRIWREISNALEHSEVRIRRVNIPESENADYSDITPRYRYSGLLSAFSAYLDSKARKITVDDNAFILIPDEDSKFSLIISMKIRTYRLLGAIHRIWKEKREKHYVGK